MRLERYVEYVDGNGNVESVIVWDWEKTEVQLLFRNGHIKTLPWSTVEKYKATDLSSVDISRFLILDNIVTSPIECDRKDLEIEIALKAWGKIFQEDRKIGDADWKEKLATVIRKRLEGTGYDVFVDTEGLYGETHDGQDVIVSTIDVEIIKEFKANKEVKDFMVKAVLIGVDTVLSEEATKVFQRAVASGECLEISDGAANMKYQSDVMYDSDTEIILHRVRCSSWYPTSKDGVEELLDEMKDYLVFKNKCD